MSLLPLSPPELNTAICRPRVAHNFHTHIKSDTNWQQEKKIIKFTRISKNIIWSWFHPEVTMHAHTNTHAVYTNDSDKKSTVTGVSVLRHQKLPRSRTAHHPGGGDARGFIAWGWETVPDTVFLVHPWSRCRNSDVQSHTIWSAWGHWCSLCHFKESLVRQTVKAQLRD